MSPWSSYGFGQELRSYFKMIQKLPRARPCCSTCGIPRLRLSLITEAKCFSAFKTGFLEFISSHNSGSGSRTLFLRFTTFEGYCLDTAKKFISTKLPRRKASVGACRWAVTKP